MHFIMIKIGEFTTKPWCWGSSSTSLYPIMFAAPSHTKVQDLTMFPTHKNNHTLHYSPKAMIASSLYANFSAIFSTSISMEDGYIYRGEEEVGIHTIVEGRPYTLGGFPIRWKQEAKGGRSWLFNQTTPYDSSTKLLWSKLRLYLKKKFHKQIGAGA